MSNKYPVSRKQNTTNKYFNTQVSDPFQWLENSENPDTKKWVLEQQDFGRNYLNQLPGKAEIFSRLNGLYNYAKERTPFILGKHTFSFRNTGLQNQDTLHLYNPNSNVWELLFDPNAHDTNGTLAIDNLSASDNGRLLAFTVSYGGSDWQEIWVLNIETGTIIEKNIKWVKFSDIAWHNEGFYYNRYPAPTKLAYSTKNEQALICYHNIGTEQTADKIIYQDEKHPKRGFNVEVTSDKNYLVIYAIESTSGNAVYLMDLNTTGKITPLFDDFNADRHLIDVHNDELLILTNDGAPNQKIVAINPKTKATTEVIAEGADLIERCLLFDNTLALIKLHNASHQLELHNLRNKTKHAIALPGLGSINGFVANRDSRSVYFGFSSFAQPVQNYTLDLIKKEIQSIAQVPLPFSPADYTTKQVWYQSSDGTKVPMFITHKKDLDLTQTHPTLLYGYGGFNISLTPTFNPSRIFWLESGGILAIPNLRGGGEFGENWHKQGTLQQKQNVFDDFIAAAQYLIKQNLTSPEKLTIHGGSNGGLLVGAVVNQRPDLFKVAIPAVGVMDMLRYQNFTIGHYWATDYGTSNDSQAMFNYLMSYSPLHNITSKPYPATLVITAEKDDRVVPAHSFKYAAQMQTTNPNGICILRIEGEAGHGAGKPIGKQLDEQADIYAFILSEINI